MSEGNVQLKLQASLDLSFLRAQVASLGKSLQAENVSVVATLDAKQLQKDVAKLGKKITLKVNDSALDATIDRINAVETRLKNLQSADNKVVIGVTAKSAVTQKDARKVRADIHRSIMENGGKILLPVGLRPISQTAVDAFKADLRQKLGSITVNVQAQLESAAVRKGAKTPAEIDAEVRRHLQAISEIGASRMAGGGSGGVTESARRESLRKSIEDLTVAQLKQVARQLEVGGASKLRRADLINKIVADASVEMVKKYLDPQGMMRGGDRSQLQKVLDTFARGVFNMLGMDPASVQAKRLPPAVSWPAQVPERPVSIGPSSTGRALPGAAAPSMLPGTRFTDQKRLVGDILSPSLKEVLRGAANAFVDSVRSEMNAAVRSVNVRDFGNAISKMPMLPAAAPQAMLPAGRRGGALAVQSELGDFYRTVEAQVRTAFDMIADYHARSLRSFQQSYQQAIKNYHQNVLSAAAGQGLRSVQVVDLGRSQPILAGAEGGSPPRLPPAGGSGFRGGGGFVPPGGFPSDGPQGLSRPIRAPQTELPKGYLTAGKMAAALKDADQYLRQTRVPLAGAIEGLASEFASATKQVLLYGTAYKALAFFMDLPSQALSAATALQTFRNQLNAVTGSSENASRSFAFIDGLADRFAVPLESVRQGFVRMYASMEPAGFGAAEIEGLFTGVSKAAATFGMSKDQVDRVTYALSQMASKGQIMAEELRGQLGDVLPGSFALFAEAAQMSIPEFTKAMEQGRFSGEAMRAVLNNVAILLNTKFASGAEGAAKTLQGALNTMGTGLQRMYEAFEPLVNEVAQKVFPLIASAVSDATIAIKAFTSAVQGNQTAANALSGNARSIYDAMQGVAEIGKAIGSIFMQLLPTLELVGKAFLFVIEQIARFINTQFGSFLAGLTVQVLLLTAALSALAKTGIALAIAGLINLSRQITILKAQKKALIVLSANLKLGLIALGGIAVLAAIKALADGLRGPEERLRAMQQRLAEAKKGFDDLAKAGHVAELTSQLTQARQEETAAERALLQAQARSRRTVTETGMMEPTSVSTEREELRLQETIERRVALEKSLRNAERVAAPSLPPPELQAIPLAPSDLTGGAGAADDAAREAEKRQRELERLQNQQQQMILANAELQAKLQEIEFNEGKDIAEEKFSFIRRLIDAEYDYRLSKANEIQAVQLRLEKQLSDSRLSALESVENALMRMQEARLRTTVAEQKAVAAKAADALAPDQLSNLVGPVAARLGTTGGTLSAPILPTERSNSVQRLLQAANKNLGLFAGSTERCADAIRVLFKEAGIAIGVTKQAWDGLESGSRLASGFFGGDIGQRITRQEDLRPGDLVGFERTYGNWGPGVQTHVGMYAGEGMMYDHSSRKGLVRRPMSTFAGKFMYGVRPAALGGAGVATPGTEAPLSGPAFSVEKRSQKAEDEQVVAQREEDAVRNVALLRLNNELQASIKQSRAEIAEAVGAALPTSQLELENQLLEQRNALVLQGASEEQIELEQNKAIAQSKSASVQEALRKAISEAESGLKSYDKRLADGAITQEVYDIAITGINDRLKMLRESLGEIDPALERYNAQLLRAKEINDSMEPQLRIATALNEARKEMKSLLDPSQQLITVASGIGNAFGDAFKGLVSGASSARETMANFFQSISNVFTDMLARIIAEWAKIQLIQGLSGFLPGLGSFAGGAGFGGPVLLPTGADIGAGGGILQNAQGQGFGTPGPDFGFRQFATGGIVKGPTLGLVGEGRFNEAVVPLPDGKSIPVELGKDGGNQIISNITITVNDGKAQSSSSGGGSSEFGKRMESAVKQVIVNELRPGGVLSGRR
jgi:tape measure domain-containing protein